MTGGSAIDFGSLDETAQRECIARASRDRRLAADIEEANPAITELRRGLSQPDPGLVEENRLAIQSRYGRQECARLLREVHATVIEQPVRQRIDRKALLDQFLSPDRFRILETR